MSAGGKWEGNKSGKRVGIDKIEEPDEISGFFFVLRTKVYEEVGGFDNAYTPAGREEIDMSLTVRSRGYKCLVVRRLHISHYGRHGISSRKGTVSFMGRTIDIHELDRRNKEYFKSRWVDGKNMKK
jgi:GT2 family glycosyltransferase